MHYCEFQPTAALRPFLRCYWSLRANAKGEAPTVERIVPDGCPEIVVNRADPFQRIYPGASPRRQEEILVVGQFTRPIDISSTGEVNLIGIRFEPGGLHAVFGIPMNEFVNVDTCLSQINRSLRADLLSACRPGPVEDRLSDLNALFLRTLHRAKRSIPHNAGFIGTAVRLVESGCYTADGLATAIGINRRALERIFRTEVGLSPKLFARICRIQSVLHGLDQGAHVHDWAAIAASRGFSDQSHLIREFRLLAGTTPKRYLKERTEMSALFEMGDLSHSSNR